MWTLLVIFASGATVGSTAVIPNFAKVEVCEAAGAMLEKKESWHGQPAVQMSWTCLPNRSAKK